VPPDPNAAVKAETERLKAETELEKARAEGVKALGLPSFEGKSTLNQNAGAIEALVLATDAIGEAARQIAEDAMRSRYPVSGTYIRHFLIMAGDEQLDFDLVAAIRAEIAGFEAIFAAAPSEHTPLAADAGLAGPVAAISAIAGLLRSDVQVTAVDHATAITHRVLATAVAGQLRGRAILPHAAVSTLFAESPLIDSWTRLLSRRDTVALAAQNMPAGKGETPQASLARFDAFMARITTPDAAGRIPLVHAARLELIATRKPLVLRVYVEKAGGSLIQRSNILTFFGADPIRVSGALVYSYAITDPETGLVLAAKVRNRRTTVATLRQIQGGTSPPEREATVVTIPRNVSATPA